MKKRIRYTLLAATLAPCLISTSVSAAPSVDELKGSKAQAESEAAALQDELTELLTRIDELEGQLIENGEKLIRTEADLSAAEEKEAKQYEDMKTRIKYMYEHGNATLLEMLFSAEDMTDFLNKADFIENLSEYDRESLDKLKEIHQQIEDEKTALEEQQSSLSELQSSLESQQQELQAKADATSTDLAEVSQRLEQAKKEEAERIAREEAARKAAEEAAAAETAAQNGSGGYDNSVVNGGSVSASTDDITLLAALLDCEAVASYDAMLAVATVIMNRVESPRFGNSISSVIYASGQFEPVWTGRLDARLESGPSSLAIQVAQDAINGSRLAAVSDCYYFLYAPSTNRDGINIGGNLFFTSW